MTKELTPGITKLDIAALRNADSVTFHHFDGRSLIRAHIRWIRDSTPVYTAAQQRMYPSPDQHNGRERSREIATDAKLHGYKADGCDAWHGGDSPKASAFHMEFSMTAELRTIAELLHADDILTLEWTANNDNENNKSVGWHRDELRLIVRRGARVMTFLIDVYVGPDNSARMIRQGGYRRDRSSDYSMS